MRTKTGIGAVFDRMLTKPNMFRFLERCRLKRLIVVRCDLSATLALCAETLFRMRSLDSGNLCLS